MKKLLGTFAIAFLGGAVALGSYTYFLEPAASVDQAAKSVSLPTSFSTTDAQVNFTRSGVAAPI